MKAKIDLFSTLLRELEAEIGARDLATLTLEALKDSIKALKAENRSAFEVEFDKILELLSSTEPKFGILNHCFGVLKEKFDMSSDDDWQSVLTKNIDVILKHRRIQNRQIYINAEKLDVEGKTILIHGHSHSVHDVLTHYKKMGRKFNVVIAEQDFEKTHDSVSGCSLLYDLSCYG
jgi:translation initiation factor 2B subunit (eIF-2B alpha/beta/delta family)